MKYDLIVIGGGAAGLFAAIHAAPGKKVLLLEKTAVLLAKVRVSGGGRCNVTHACFDPKVLVQNYPRGSRELVGPFHRFGPRDTINWFEKRGVKLKTEKDGRMFPVTDNSQTIIDCLLNEAKRVGVEIRTRQRVQSITPGFTLYMQDGNTEICDRLLLATGSSPEGHHFAHELGHTIVPPVPSLFTFNVPGSSLADLSGIAVEDAELRIVGLEQRGPLLITHFGFSGPAALKLSAWGARKLHACQYKAELCINWLPSLTEEEIFERLKASKEWRPLPRNLWKRLTESGKPREIARRLHADLYQVDGKTTHKEEFVTCGGVELKEVDFRTMESKKCPGLLFAGEVLDIDGITGGFNFQNAWTTGMIAGTWSVTG
jgi:predicted Rossmann fold flavoprotein